ncbi:unnamed protein product [Darwinula stevensoni]|uniref:Uncharacterized protein n=1 Tax=Darwinula stevensoni TaxID=69355 RepID=A0A7R9AA03_9CRUS|nr:unnamed protein product [Darwinula stevensoni]CAG0897860.1 unnamed protein product [Darwinula stevensoni]
MLEHAPQGRNTNRKNTSEVYGIKVQATSKKAPAPQRSRQKFPGNGRMRRNRLDVQGLGPVLTTGTLGSLHRLALGLILVKNKTPNYRVTFPQALTHARVLEDEGRKASSHATHLEAGEGECRDATQAQALMLPQQLLGIQIDLPVYDAHIHARVQNAILEVLTSLWVLKREKPDLKETSFETIELILEPPPRALEVQLSTPREKEEDDMRKIITQVVTIKTLTDLGEHSKRTGNRTWDPYHEQQKGRNLPGIHGASPSRCPSLLGTPGQSTLECLSPHSALPTRDPGIPKKSIIGSEGRHVLRKDDQECPDTQRMQSSPELQPSFLQDLGPPSHDTLPHYVLGCQRFHLPLCLEQQVPLEVYGAWSGSWFSNTSPSIIPSTALKKKNPSRVHDCRTELAEVRPEYYHDTTLLPDCLAWKSLLSNGIHLQKSQWMKQNTIEQRDIPPPITAVVVSRVTARQLHKYNSTSLLTKERQEKETTDLPAFRDTRTKMGGGGTEVFALRESECMSRDDTMQVSSTSLRHFPFMGQHFRMSGRHIPFASVAPWNKIN